MTQYFHFETYTQEQSYFQWGGGEYNKLMQTFGAVPPKGTWPFK